MIGITGIAPPLQIAIDGLSGRDLLASFQDEIGGTLAEVQPRPVLVEGTAGLMVEDHQ